LTFLCNTVTEEGLISLLKKIDVEGKENIKFISNSKEEEEFLYEYIKEDEHLEHAEEDDDEETYEETNSI